MSPIKGIDQYTLNDWLNRDECVLIDVREPSEYAVENIKHAHLIPLGSIEKSKLPTFDHKKLVFYCGIGKRSAMAAAKLENEIPGLTTYHLEGGIVGWKKAGLSVEHQQIKAGITLDRQLQIMLGIMVFLGLIGNFISPYFLLISLFGALLLVYAGISGTCRFAMLMANMPWNRK